MRKFLFAALILASTTVANAAIIGSPEVSQRSLAGTPANTVVNALTINFDQQLFGQQLVVELTSGTVFQQATFGTETAPTDALIPVFADVASDSFVTMGGFTSGTSQSVLVVGGSTEIPGKNGPKKFDTAGVNIAWAPAPGVVIPNGTNFPVAQISLSNNANGSVFLFSNAGGNGLVYEGTVTNGVISFVPEPTTCVLAGLALVGTAARRRV